MMVRWLAFGMVVMLACAGGGADDDDRKQGSTTGSGGAGGGGGHAPEPTGELLWYLIASSVGMVTASSDGMILASGLACESARCLAKLDFNGTTLWSKQVDLGHIAATPDGGAVAYTAILDQADFGGGLVGNTSPSLQSHVVVRYDGSGAHLWSKAFDSGQASVDGLVVDDAGDIFIAGGFRESITLGATTLTEAFPLSSFLAKLDPNGGVIFARIWPNYLRTSLAPDGDGGVFAVSDLGDTFDYGGGPLSPPASSDYAACMVRLDASGNHLFSSFVGHAGTLPYQQQLALAPDGDVVLAHSFWTEPGSADFGDGPIMSDGIDAFVMRWSPEGAARWVQAYAMPSYQYTRVTATDPFGNIIMGGEFAEAVDFGGGSLLGKPESLMRSDVYLVKLDGSGQHLWSQVVLGGDIVSVGSAAIDLQGRIAISGEFTKTVDFGNGPEGAGGGAFLAVYAP